MEKYKDLLDNAIKYYISDEETIKYFNRLPLSRYHSFKYCIEYINNRKSLELSKIIELGTSRSYVDGRFPGCNLDNQVYWEPNNPEKWDWSAGCFTRVFGELANNCEINTVDIEENHIKRCKLMTKDFSNKIKYYVTSSENFLKELQPKTVDLLYLDTGDMTPIEFTAALHLREAKIIVEKDILKDDGLILIDDVRNCTPKKAGEISDYGKAKYSIPYFLENGYEIVMDEYQVILKKIQI
jgi:hypothetical protein